MRLAPLRFLGAAAWPLTIWFSLTHLEEHSADDYVERTSPIVATAIAFWICAAILLVLTHPPIGLAGGSFEEGGEVMLAVVRRTPQVVVDVLWFFTPLMYVIGFWLFTTRDEAYPR